MESMTGVNMAYDNSVPQTNEDNYAYPTIPRSVTPENTSITNSRYDGFPTRSSPSMESFDRNTANSSTASRNTSIALGDTHDVSDYNHTLGQPEMTTIGELNMSYSTVNVKLY